MKKRIKYMKKHFKKKAGRENEHINAILAQDTENALLRAKEVLTFSDDKYSDPIVIVTPNTDTDRRVRFRITKLAKHVEVDVETTEEKVAVKKKHNKKKHNFDIRVDYDYAKLITIFLGEKSLFFHRSIMDYITGRVEEDVAHEIAYKDIIGVSTFIGYDDPKNPRLSSVVLNLSLLNSEVIDIPLRNHYLYEQGELQSILTEKEEYIIKTIKKAIRTVK
ncbi:MAG TPA: hypothetical protein VJ845_00800 [Haploplasma sp.]|nr:hypothetical protein [Haploplasma sp.]